MSVLLASDELTLYRAEGKDAHGWALPGSTPAWTGKGSLQLTAGLTDQGATFFGGAGPYDPARAQQGTVYLPPDAPAVEGMVLVARDHPYVLGALRFVGDPVGAGADCLVASVSELMTVVQEWG